MDDVRYSAVKFLPIPESKSFGEKIQSTAAGQGSLWLCRQETDGVFGVQGLCVESTSHKVPGKSLVFLQSMELGADAALKPFNIYVRVFMLGEKVVKGFFNGFFTLSRFIEGT